MRVYRELVEVLIDTEELFKQIKHTSVKHALGYFAFISFISLAINWLLLWAGIQPAGLIPFEKLALNIEVSFLIPFLYFVAGFFFVGLFSLIVRTYLARAGTTVSTTDCFRAVAYGVTPALLSIWFPVLGLVLILWSLYLMAQGLGVYNKAPLKTNLKASVVGGVLTAIPLTLLVLVVGIALVENGFGSAALLWTVLIPL